MLQMALTEASHTVAGPKLLWDVAIAQVKLQTCDRKHRCRGGQDLPTRLLDLRAEGDVARIKLIVTKETQITDPRYAALSYCWGFSTPFTTTPSTFQNRLEGFAVSDMPATLRETVQVTKELGIRYLWIDALCILQGGFDDVEAQADWKRESTSMNQVFGNAYLTIVAAASPDSNGGLIPKTSGQQTPGPSDRANSDNNKVYFGSEPLLSRAWAQQEWLLSARLLVFTKASMHFVCDVWEAPARHRSHSFRLPKSQRAFDPDGWRSIVTDFCARDLTMPQDKLPAISGLAKRFSEISNGTLGDYLAGFWRAELDKHLIWRAEEPGAGFAMLLPRTLSSGRSIVNGRMRAPSWSWAAVDGPVTIFTVSSGLSTILSCDVKSLPGHDEFGEVMSGSLVIRCPQITASVGGENPGHLTLRSDAGGSCNFWPDDPSEVDQLREDQLFCLAISTMEVFSPVRQSTWVW